jgi:5-methyltetrahydropteroyltriglutamate--homocysteine methyltransferase
MKRSTERILTTHAGSLPRPAALLSLVLAQEAGKPVVSAQLDAEVRSAVKAIVKKQAEVGVDVLNDGEQSKPSYATYVKDRLGGFGGESSSAEVIGARADLAEFPDFAQKLAAGSVAEATPLRFAACDGPISYQDLTAVEQDIENLKAAAGEAKAEELFMSAASPGVIAMFFPNRHYPGEAAYLEAIATAMRREYEAIHRAGLVLQLDCPDLAIPVVGTPLDEFRRQIALRVEALNHAVAGIPAEAMRIHVCWGNWEMPRKNDVPLAGIIDILLGARPAGMMLMASNGRHAHEWRVFEDVALPDGKYLIPGVLDTTTNVIEHPEVVAQRLALYARVVGRENVMAGTDCGFGTGAGMQRVVPSVVWAKLQAMAEGAALASKELW